MTSSTTSNIYIHVIEDVITKVRDENNNNAATGDTVLNDLQGIWEMKMMQAGAILGPIDRSAAPRDTPGTVHDLNVPYEGTEEFETPTADMLFPPTPLQTPLPGSGQTPLPGTVQTPLPGTAYTPGMADIFNIPTGGTPFTPNEYSPGNEAIGIPEPKAGVGRPSPYMQPPTSWLNQRAPLDVNVAYVEAREDGERGAPHQPLTQDFLTMSAGKRKRDDVPSQIQPGSYIPQQDGSGDGISDGFKVQGSSTRQTNADIEINVQGIRLSSKIPQLDGPMPDPYDEMLSTPNIYYNQGVVNEDYNIATPAPNDIQAATPAPVMQNENVDDDADEPLNENDDDGLDDAEQGEDLNT